MIPSGARKEPQKSFAPVPLPWNRALPVHEPDSSRPTPHSTNPRKRWPLRKKLALVGALCLALFLFMELGVRLFITREFKRERLQALTEVSSAIGRFCAHDQVAYGLTPGYRSTDRIHTINAFGCRGPEAQVPKPDGRTRVLCLGASTTYGHYVTYEQAHPAVLEAELQKAGWGRRRHQRRSPRLGLARTAPELRASPLATRAGHRDRLLRAQRSVPAGLRRLRARLLALPARRVRPHRIECPAQAALRPLTHVSCCSAPTAEHASAGIPWPIHLRMPACASRTARHQRSSKRMFAMRGVP